MCMYSAFMLIAWNFTCMERLFLYDYKKHVTVPNSYEPFDWFDQVGYYNTYM